MLDELCVYYWRSYTMNIVRRYNNAFKGNLGSSV